MQPEGDSRPSEDESGALSESPALSLAIFIVGFAAGISILVILDQMGLMRTATTRVLVVLPFLVALAVAWPARARRHDVFLADKCGVSAGINGAAMAAAAVSATLLMAGSGAMFSTGHDGLPVVTGLIGGFMLMALLLAPYLARSGALTIAEFLGHRFGGAMRTMAALVIAALAFIVLAVQLSALSFLVGLATPLSGLPAVAAIAFALLLCVLAGGMRTFTWTGAVLVLLVVVALLVAGGTLGWRTSQNPLAPLAYGQALRDIADLELSLIGRKLADGASLKRHAVAYLSSDALNAVGAALGFMASVAAMPHVLGRSFAARAAREARASAAGAMLLVLLIVVTLPALAAFGKLAFLKLVAAGTELDALPAWIYEYGRADLVKVCGASATAADAVAAACKSAPGFKGLLRAQDLAIDPSAFLLVLPSLAGLPQFFSGSMAAAVVAAALSVTIASAVVLSGALSSDLAGRIMKGDSSANRQLVLARVMASAAMLAAASLVATRAADFALLATWVVPLAAATLFPALVLGIWWRRSNAPGAIAGMLAGGGIVLYYLVATRYAPVAFFEQWFGFSNAGMSAVMKYQSLRAAAEAAAPENAAALAAVEAQARLIANWWGIRPAAAGLFGLPVGFAVHVAVALITPRPGSDTQSFIDRLRDPRRSKPPSAS